MKRGIKSLLVLVVFGLFGMLLVGGVSAEYSLNYLARDYTSGWYDLINNDIVITTDSYVTYSTTQGNWVPSPTITEDLRLNVVGERNVEGSDPTSGFFVKYKVYRDSKVNVKTKTWGDPHVDFMGSGTPAWTQYLNRLDTFQRQSDTSILINGVPQTINLGDSYEIQRYDWIPLDCGGSNHNDGYTYLSINNVNSNYFEVEQVVWEYDEECDHAHTRLESYIECASPGQCPAIVCGDGTCDTEFGENCSSCVADCPCGAGEICQDGICCLLNTCSGDYSGLCGSSLDDGCSGTLDCSDNCGAEEICQDGICILPPITNAYWADMQETPISTAHLNDKVKLMVAGSGMDTKLINYEIWKSVRFWFDDKVADTDTTGFITWRASEAGEYYFKAEVEGVSMESEYLVVSGTEDNFASVVNIVGPKIGDIFYIGEEMNFEQTSYDEDDEITLLWDLGDDTTSSESSLTHSYSVIGQKTIKLTATDERGLAVTDRIAILIIDPAGTKYVFAHIDNPEWGEIFYGESARVVEFNASSTYAVETSGCTGAGCTTDCCTIDCLGGACHALTHEYGQAINPNGMVGNYASFNFSWTFDDGSWNNGMGLVEFDWVFRIAGKHKAWLSASTNPFSSTEVEFSGFFTYPYCYRDKLTDNTFWYEPSGVVVLSLDDCYRDPGLNPQPTTDCCPPGYLCEDNECKLLQGIPSCGQYTEYGQQTCEVNIFPAEDALNPILETEGLTCGGSREYGTKCWEIVDCKCAWKDEECLSVAEQIVCDATTCWNMTDLPPTIKTICGDTELPFSGECSFGFDLTDKCDTDGWIERTWDATWISSEVTQGELKPAYCVAGSDQLNCKMTKLTFFTIATLIVTILIIIIIYWFMVRKEKKKGKKK